MAEGVTVPGVEHVSELGRGARTVVYRARRGDREYAVKVLRTVGGRNEALAFRREAALLAGLDHPGLPDVHDVGEADGHPYLVMDLVIGRPLSAALRAEQRLDETRTATLGAEVADALAVAHRAGLVHRDVKPDNIMIGPDERARVIDFGFATRTGSDVADAAVGTFAYSAPEQTGMLRRPVDGRADLYALGVVLFECLTGELPFRAGDTGELIQMHLAVPAPDVRTVRPDVSPALAAVVDALLAKDPDDRYQSGDGLGVDLLRVAGGQREAFALSTGLTRTADEGELVGRDDERARLRARWRQVVDGGGGGVVLVQGASGTGKSRLVREFTGVVAAAGATVLHGAYGADEALPLAPVRSAIDGYVQAVARLDGPARQVAEDRLRAATADAAGLLRPLSEALGRLLPGPETPVSDDPYRFVDAVAAFLVKVADEAGGAVLHLDDAQWFDDDTRRVVGRLVPLLADSRLLLVVTARDDAESRPAVERFVTDAGPACDLHLTLAGLDDATAAELVASRLGALTVPNEVAARLAARSGGSPLAVGEYVRAVLDAGLLRPSWGTWLLDESGLEALALPADIMALVLRRVDGLGGPARELLTVAAAMGRRFRAELVAAVSRTEVGTALVAFADAATRQLIEPVDGGAGVFVHDRVREALLSELDEDALRELHQRIAEEWDRTGPGGPEQVYAVARHYLAGRPDRVPQRVFAAATTAGRLALTQHALADAVDFLTRAEAVAQAAGIPPDAGFHVDLGVAASRIGLYAAADQHLGRALELERDPLRRAALYGRLAEMHYSRWEGDKALNRVAQGLAELGHPLPRHAVALAASTLAQLVAGIVMGLLPRRIRSVTGTTRERYRLRARLHDIGVQSAALGVRLPLMTALALRSLYLVNRLGTAPEHFSILAALAITARIARLRRLSDRILRRIAAAAASGDAHAVAHYEFLHGVTDDAAPPVDGRSGRRIRHTVERYGGALDQGEYLTAVSVVAYIQLIRGYLDDVTQWFRRAVARGPGSGEVLGTSFACLEVHIAALSGRPGEAAAKLGQIRDFLATNPENRLQRISVAVAAAHIAVERGTGGTDLDDAVAEFDAMGVRPAMVWSFQRMFWIHQAFGRLAQAAAAPATDRAAPLATARRAVAALRGAADGPVLRAYHRVARASLRQLGGDHRGALRDLARLQAWAGELDLPLLNFEAARVRARAYRALGHTAEAGREARVALLLADENGWHARARWIRSEFGMGGTSTRASSSVVVGGGSERRRLDALQQVSLAAATVFDPRQLTRVALDEIVRIFGAERAFLFLRGDFLHEADTHDGLRPYLGREADGTDLDELTGYGSTLVERVAAEGEPVVVTGSEEGAALGSQSTLVHNLRSIMVAPLKLRGRLLGVIYLDSRAAKGIFTTDDIDILTALTNHVALSLETARAAQLELAVHAARRERDLAETLRAAMTDLTATLEPDAVCQRLTGTVARVLSADVAVMLRRQLDGTLTLAGLTGVEAPDTPDLDPTGDATLTDLLAATTVRGGTRDQESPPLPDLFGVATAAWLAVPLLVRDEHRGLLLVATAADRPYTDAEAQIAAALASQGMAALDNALHFQQIQDLAQNDGLTSLFNRRHFFKVGGRYLTESTRTAETVATIMVDIDHFKRINDTYGHLVGDTVIREVAHRLSGSLRKSDLVCRYGGEEFAILLADTTSHAIHATAERLRATVADRPIATEAGDLTVTISVGVAAPSDAIDDLTILLNHADEALYQAKRGGRNKVIVTST